MGAPTLAVNALGAISVRLLTHWGGPWLADVDLDLDDTKIVPSGRCALKIGSAPLVGTVDERASGKFGEKACLRIVAGGGGWDKPVSAKDYANPAGVFSAAVLATTAAEVGETAVELAEPTRYGVHYVRGAGPASRVLAGLDWYVTPQGITTIGPRVPVPQTSDVEILEWDPIRQVATLAADVVIAPGTVLIDKRFGTAVVRDIEQTFTAAGARATAWCATSPSSQLIGAIRSLIREEVRATYMRAYRYRVVANALGVFELQAVKKAPGLPDILPITVWTGASGVSATVVPSSEVLVEFIAGDPAQPVVRAFDDTIPLELALAAVTAVNVTAPLLAVSGAITAATIAAGPMAVTPTGVAVGGELAGALVKEEPLAAWVAAVISVCGAHTPPITIPPLEGAGTSVLKGL